MPDDRVGLALFLLVVVWGWLWGSFINQVVDRTPRRTGETPGKSPPGLLHPSRSFCFGCGRTIPWYENLPVISWLLLGGACRECGASIGLRTLVMEALMPLAFVLILPALTPVRAPLWLLPFPFLLWSWVQLGGALVLERRRPGRLFWLGGLVSLAGCGILLAPGWP